MSAGGQQVHLVQYTLSMLLQFGQFNATEVDQAESLFIFLCIE